MVKNRAPLVWNILEECRLDAFVFFHPTNLRFLCGFTGTDGALVAGGGKAFFLTDSRYTMQARHQVLADQIMEYRVKLEGVLSCLEENGFQRIGFEAETLPYATAQKLKEKAAVGTQWIPVAREVQSFRGIKDSSETAALREACSLNAAAFEEVLPLIRSGITEKEISLALEFSLKRLGGEEKAFDFIVASGERGALPHGVASGKKIQDGELVTLDFGVRLKGYHSDETVTVAVGSVSRQLREIFDIVLEAHDLAMAAVRPGRPLREIDEIARNYIVEAGYGDYFGHGLGHGVGLEVHEFPTVSSRSEETAMEGMIFTIEPGIYIPGLGGVRIEDMIEVTADGCRPLTAIPKAFRAIPA
jgi:Xaa-Pro aminopeptidase